LVFALPTVQETPPAQVMARLVAFESVVEDQWD
jgi:hypothetical protein